MRTYTEAQYSTPASQQTILEWLGPDWGPPNVTRVARYMSQILRIGGMGSCRILVHGAIQTASPEWSAPNRPVSNLKPETSARLAREHAESRAARTEDLRRRLKEKAEQQGPDSIYAEMLSEMENRA